MANAKRTLSLFLALAITIFALTVIPTAAVHFRNSPQARLRWAGIALVLLAARLLFSERVRGVSTPKQPRLKAHVRPTTWRRPTDTREPVSEIYIAEARRTFARRFSVKDCVPQLAAIVADPSAFVFRLSEEMEFQRDSVLQLITRTLMKSESPEDAPWLVPVLRPRKGELVHRLHLEIDASTGSTLTFVESMGAVALVVEAMFEAAFPVATRVAGLDYGDILRRVLQVCLAPSLAGRGRRRRMHRRLRKLPWTSTEPVMERYRRSLKELISYLQDSYFIIAILPAHEGSGRTKLRTERTFDRREKLRTPIDRIRTALGLTVRSVLIDLPYATESRSYHFTTTSPDGAYFYYVNATPVILGNDAVGDLPLTSLMASNRPVMPKLFVQGEGSDCAHVYARDLGGQLHALAGLKRRDERLLGVRFFAQYRERPPGALGIISAIAAYLMALTWGIGYYYSLAFQGHSPHTPAHSTQSEIWVAILVAIPALVSSWLITRLTPDVLQRISMATFAALVWLLFNVSATVAISALALSQNDSSTVVFAGMELTHARWGLLEISTGCSFLMFAILIISKTSRYWLRSD